MFKNDNSTCIFYTPLSSGIVGMQSYDGVEYHPDHTIFAGTRQHHTNLPHPWATGFFPFSAPSHQVRLHADSFFIQSFPLA
jgi:hypothetical protein